MPEPETLLVRPAEPEGLVARALSRLFPYAGYVVETLDGREVARLDVRPGRPNAYRADGLGSVTFAGHGVLAPRFDVVQEGRTLLGLAHDVVGGRMTLVGADGARHRLEREGLLLPEHRLRGPDGEVVLSLEATQLHGRGFRARLRPGDAWPRERLLAAVGLLLHSRVSFAIAFSAVAGAAALAPARAGAAGR